MAAVVCVYANCKHVGKQITKKIPFTLPYALNAGSVAGEGWVVLVFGPQTSGPGDGLL